MNSSIESLLGLEISKQQIRKHVIIPVANIYDDVSTSNHYVSISLIYTQSICVLDLLNCKYDIFQCNINNIIITIATRNVAMLDKSVCVYKYKYITSHIKLYMCSFSTSYILSGQMLLLTLNIKHIFYDMGSSHTYLWSHPHIDCVKLKAPTFHVELMCIYKD